MQIIVTQSLTYNAIRLELHTHSTQAINFSIYNPVRQTEFRNAVLQHTTYFMQCLEHRHIIPIFSHITSKCKTGRTATCHRYFYSVRRCFIRRSLLIMLAVVISGKTLEITESLNMYNAVENDAAKQFHLKVKDFNISVTNGQSSSAVKMRGTRTLDIQNLKIDNGSINTGAVFFNETGYKDGGEYKGGVNIADIDAKNMGTLLFNHSYGVIIGNLTTTNMAWVDMTNIGNVAFGEGEAHESTGRGIEFTGNVLINGGGINGSSSVYFKSANGISGTGGLVFTEVGNLDGGLKPENIERISAETLASNQNYSYIVGDKETVITDCYEERPMLSSRELMIELKKQGRFDAPSRIAESDSKGNPQQEWVNASIAGKQSMSNFDYAAPFTEMALLLTIASSCPEPVEYDVKNMKFKNFKEGDKRLNSMYKYNKEFLPYDVKQPAV